VGPGEGDASATEGGESAEAAAQKAAPIDRVKAAVALGPEALEELAKEFPEDTSLRARLAVAYQASGRAADALRTVRALLVADPKAAGDDEIVQLVATMAAKGKGDDDDEAFAILEGPLGERGVDALIELTAKGPGREVRDLRARAARSLAKPEVRAHASPPALVLLDLRAATTCPAKRDLLPRVKEQGDARLGPPLKSLKIGRGCGFLGRADCWACLRKDTTLDDALTAVEARPGPR
jgi:serine/threonine-protein kinase